jgi:hypothetical protein
MWTGWVLGYDSELGRAWAMRAASENHLGALDEAAASAARAVQLDEGDWLGHYVLACVEAKRWRGGDPAPVLRHLRRVLELWPAGRAELAGEPELAPLRELPAFRELVGGAGG